MNITLNLASITALIGSMVVLALIPSVSVMTVSARAAACVMIAIGIQLLLKTLDWP